MPSECQQKRNWKRARGVLLLRTVQVKNGACSLPVSYSQIIEEKLGRSPNRTIHFYSFSQDRDSSLNSDEGREMLLNAGIRSTREVGKWIEERLRDYLHQDDVANRFLQFLNQQI